MTWRVSAAWQLAIRRRNGPTLLTLTRQNVPVLDRQLYDSAVELSKGAYVLADLGEKSPELILMASGSEVSLIVEAGGLLAAEGVNVRLVSFPSWELFAAQPQSYRNLVLPLRVKARLPVEAGVAQGWERWTGDEGAILSIERFGASAPYKTIYEKFGLTVEHVIELAQTLI